MRYWFDTEFIEDGKLIDLVSIGIWAEDGRSFYSQSTDSQWWNAAAWVQENVLPKLQHCEMQPDDNMVLEKANHALKGARCHSSRCPWDSRSALATYIENFCNPAQFGKPEFWGYFADYDWVVLCQLFGPMVNLPKGWPMYCRDIKQWADMLGNPPLPTQGKDEHHALKDAFWNVAAWSYLEQLSQHPEWRVTLARPESE